MRRISLLLVSLIVLTVQTALAQTFSVKGTVMSADDNEPLIGATILQEGTTNGVVTDVDGNYTIEVKDASKATLVISYIGMVTQKHPVNAQTKTLNITLTSDSKVMDEVVVVAYGVRKKGTIAGSVSAVKAEKIEMSLRQASTRLCRDRVLVCRSSALLVNQARLLLSKSVVQTLSTLVSHHFLSWMVCQFPVLISIL